MAGEYETWFDNSFVHLSETDILVNDLNHEFNNFKDFYLKRRKRLKERLISRIIFSKTIQEGASEEDFDEEVVEEEALT